MGNHIKNGTGITRVVCAVLFFLFTFLYLYSYQADILAVTQHVLSGGITRYDRTVGAIVITLLLWLLQLAIYAGTRLGGYFHALTYLPSLLLLGILTDVTDNLAHESYLGHWLWLFPLLMVGYGGVLWVCLQFESIHTQPKGVTALRYVWINMGTMVALWLMAVAIGCNDGTLQHRMRMETLMKAGRYDEALQVGQWEEETDSSLTFLRAWSLSRTRGLGEHLFEYPLVGGSDALLPNGSSVRLMLVPETRLYKDLGVVFTTKLPPLDYLENLHDKRWATTAAHDWLLCAYLLDRKIDHFAQTLPRYYAVNDSLPKHYREALTLYTHLRNNPSLVYSDAVMEADYADFQALRRKTGDARLRRTLLHDSYGKTYWYYYTCP